MDTKVCRKCLLEKNINEFSKRKDTKDGLKSHCKECNRKAYKEYHNNNKHIARERGKKWYEENKERKLSKGREWIENNRERYLFLRDRWKKENKEHLIMYWRKERTKPKNKVHNSMRSQIANAIKEKKSFRRWENILGYTLQDLINHLESKFHDGMTWDNYGEWHIDHIIPKSVFNFSSYDDIDFKRCWALSNLQPLWASDNIKKGAKIEEPFQPFLNLEVCT